MTDTAVAVATEERIVFAIFSTEANAIYLSSKTVISNHH